MRPNVWDWLSESPKYCSECEGSGECQEAESFENSYGEHGLDYKSCWNCVNIKAAQNRGRALDAELGRYKRACGVMREGLQKLVGWELHFKTEGGVFDPKLGGTEYKTVSEGVSIPANEALTKADAILRGDTK